MQCFILLNKIKLKPKLKCIIYNDSKSPTLLESIIKILTTNSGTICSLITGY